MQPTLAPAPPPLRAAPQPQNDNNASEQGMRERLLGAIQTHSIPGYQHRPGTEPPRNPHNHSIDPAISGSPGMNQHSGGEGSGGESGDRRGKSRELSTSKRAAQNRAAQRAFRQRKETHIKSLESQVREYDALNASYKGVQAENYTLKEYIVALQGELLQKSGNYPPPPPHINLQSHRGNIPENSHPQPPAGATDDHRGPPGGAPTASMHSLEQELQASAAQAVAHQRHDEAARVDTATNKRPRTQESANPPNGIIPGRPRS